MKILSILGFLFVSLFSFTSFAFADQIGPLVNLPVTSINYDSLASVNSSFEPNVFIYKPDVDFYATSMEILNESTATSSLQALTLFIFDADPSIINTSHNLFDFDLVVEGTSYATTGPRENATLTFDAPYTFQGGHTYLFYFGGENVSNDFNLGRYSNATDRNTLSYRNNIGFVQIQTSTGGGHFIYDFVSTPSYGTSSNNSFLGWLLNGTSDIPGASLQISTCDGNNNTGVTKLSSAVVTEEDGALTPINFTTRSPGAYAQVVSFNNDCSLDSVYADLSADRDFQVGLYVYDLDNLPYLQDEYDFVLFPGVFENEYIAFTSRIVSSRDEYRFTFTNDLLLQYNHDYLFVIKPANQVDDGVLTMWYDPEPTGERAGIYEDHRLYESSTYNKLTDLDTVRSLTFANSIITSDVSLTSYSECMATTSWYAKSVSCKNLYDVAPASITYNGYVYSGENWSVNMTLQYANNATDTRITIDSVSWSGTATPLGRSISNTFYPFSSLSASTTLFIVTCVSPQGYYADGWGDTNSQGCITQTIGVGYSSQSDWENDYGDVIPNQPTGTPIDSGGADGSSYEQFITDMFNKVIAFGPLAFVMPVYYEARGKIQPSVATSSNMGVSTFVIPLDMSAFGLPATDAEYDISAYAKNAYSLSPKLFDAVDKFLWAIFWIYILVRVFKGSWNLGGGYGSSGVRLTPDEYKAVAFRRKYN